MKRPLSILRRCFDTLPLHFFRDCNPRSKSKSLRFRPQIELLEDRVVPANITWTGAGTNSNWSNSHNWAGNVVPGAADTAIFNSGAKAAIVDTSFAGTVAGVQINTGYTGTITLKKALIDTGSFSQSSGTLNTNGLTLSAGGNVSITAGTFSNATGTLNLDGSGGTMLNAPTAALGNVTVNTTGTITTTSTSLDVGSLTLNSGTLVAPSGTLTIVHNLTTTSGTINSPTNSMVLFDTNSGGHTININGGAAGLLTLYNLDFGDSGSGTRTYTIANGDGFYLDGSFTAQASSTATILVNGGTFDYAGTKTLGSSYKAGKPLPVFNQVTPGTGAISGAVYDDLNGSGQEQSTDPGLLGWTVELLDSNGHLIPPTQTTGSSGGYSFLNLTPGNYSVEEVPQSGYTPTTATVVPITVTAGNNVVANFGNFQNITISGTVFYDANADGQQQLNELGIANTTVQLYTVTNGVVSTNPIQTTTDSNGNYSFSNLGPLAAGESYVVAQVAPGGTSQTKPASGSNTITLPDGRTGWLVPATGGVSVNITGQPDPNISGTGTYTLKLNDSGTSATIKFNEGPGGPSGSIKAQLSQFNVTFNNGVNPPVTFNTFCIDLLHTVGAGGTYAVAVQPDLASSYVNAGPMEYIYQNFGLSNLSSNPTQAAAVAVAEWDLSLNNHTPTQFIQDTDGTYSSGDENVFSVNFGKNPNAAAIATLVNQYLHISAGASNQGGWLDSSVAPQNHRGQNILIPQIHDSFGDQLQATTEIRTSDPQTGDPLLQTGNVQYTVPLNLTQSPPDT